MISFFYISITQKVIPILEKRYDEMESSRETFEEIQTELDLLVDDLDKCDQYHILFEENYFATNILSSCHLSNCSL